jgi:ArsR family transcriptional regulator
MQKSNECGSVDLMFRAFSDRTRLRILCLIRQKEFCVGDIADILQVPQPRISRHLAYLRKAGLVVVRKAGLWSYYALASARNPFHRKLLACLGNCLAEVPEIRADQARASEIERAGGCCPSLPRPEHRRQRVRRNEVTCELRS